MTDKSQGSFLSGLTIGLFAGAASYFLFGTKRGQKIISDLKQEWQQAKSELGDTMGADIMKKVSTAVDKLGEIKSSVGSIVKDSKLTSKKPARKRILKPRSKFSGV